MSKRLFGFLYAVFLITTPAWAQVPALPNSPIGWDQSTGNYTIKDLNYQLIANGVKLPLENTQCVLPSPEDALYYCTSTLPSALKPGVIYSTSVLSYITREGGVIESLASTPPVEIRMVNQTGEPVLTAGEEFTIGFNAKPMFKAGEYRTVYRIFINGNMKFGNDLIPTAAQYAATTPSLFEIPMTAPITPGPMTIEVHAQTMSLDQTKWSDSAVITGPKISVQVVPAVLIAPAPDAPSNLRVVPPAGQ